eukprot:TRINITY_DN16847_c0_g2_i2.p1 TRINITY_DN16847_c0_g2~~TRINITY_DN16847_c0_g2_i2.p1  ORF type:complete len:348 (+),score=68.10 TRINITY_DN16847_c0_g2_i2:72-1115(+)
MIRRPPRSTLSSSSAASDVYKRQDDARPFGGHEVDLHAHVFGELAGNIDLEADVVALLVLHGPGFEGVEAYLDSSPLEDGLKLAGARCFGGGGFAFALLRGGLAASRDEKGKAEKCGDYERAQEFHPILLVLWVDLHDAWAKVTCEMPRMAIIIPWPVLIALQMVMVAPGCMWRYTPLKRFSSVLATPERDRVTARQMAATVNHISKVRKVSASMIRPCCVRSRMATVLTRAESLTRETAWPVRGGRTRRTAWGRMMCRYMAKGAMPRLLAASHWPLSMEVIPARNISEAQAPSNRLRAATAAQNPEMSSMGAMTKQRKNSWTSRGVLRISSMYARATPLVLSLIHI